MFVLYVNQPSVADINIVPFSATSGSNVGTLTPFVFCELSPGGPVGPWAPVGPGIASPYCGPSDTPAENRPCAA